MNPEGNSSTASKDAVQVALEWKDRGNAHYGQREFKEAAHAYQAGLDALQAQGQSPSSRVNGDGDEGGGDDLPVALRSNLAQTLIKMEEFHRAEQECTTVLESFGPHAKGMSVILC